MTQTVLVLGAKGKSGRRVVPRLRARGAHIRAASRQPAPGETMFDWERPETHAPALKGVDAVYLVGPDLVDNPAAAVDAFLGLAKDAGVTRVVTLSSMGVEFPNEGPGSERYAREQLVMRSGLNWTVLRPGGFSQNFSEGFLLPGILEGDVIATATGDGATAFVDADDIAAVATAALTMDEHGCQTYVITGPEALSFAEAAAIISEAAGRTITHRQISLDAFLQMLIGAGLPADYASVMVGNQQAIRDGLGARVTDVVASVAARPPISFRDFAAEAAPAWAWP